MKIRSFTKKAIAVALLSGAAVGANAATYDLGAANVGAPLSFNAAVETSGPFSDIFTFTLPSNNGSGYSLQAFDFKTIFVTNFATFSLVSNADTIIGSTDDNLITSGVGTPKQMSFSYGSLPAGAYYLYISGVTSGSLGGLYNGAISVTAVPEPESYALFLAGLGIMGAIARRRSKANAV